MISQMASWQGGKQSPGIAIISVFSGICSNYLIRRRHAFNPHVEYIVDQFERCDEL
jgi:hypothetical protein